MYKERIEALIERYRTMHTPVLFREDAIKHLRTVLREESDKDDGPGNRDGGSPPAPRG